MSLSHLSQSMCANLSISPADPRERPEAGLN
jgi:hypothetical protein